MHPYKGFGSIVRIHSLLLSFAMHTSCFVFFLFLSDFHTKNLIFHGPKYSRNSRLFQKQLRFYRHKRYNKVNPLCRRHRHQHDGAVQARVGYQWQWETGV